MKSKDEEKKIELHISQSVYDYVEEEVKKTNKWAWLMSLVPIIIVLGLVFGIRYFNKGPSSCDYVITSDLGTNSFLAHSNLTLEELNSRENVSRSGRIYMIRELACVGER